MTLIQEDILNLLYELASDLASIVARLRLRVSELNAQRRYAESEIIAAQPSRLVEVVNDLLSILDEHS